MNPSKDIVHLQVEKSVQLFSRFTRTNDIIPKRTQFS